MERGFRGYQRFWLPPAIAKGGSSRWVYVPASIVTDLVAYVEIDRAEVVADAVAAGRYRRIRRPLVVENPRVPLAIEPGSSVRGIKLAHLGPAERQRLLVDGPDGLVPARSG